MISKVTVSDFKGQSFEHELGEKTIITGPNGSGKSAISNAIQLAVLGYIPSEKPKKRPQDIFAAFSSNDKKFSVGVQQGKKLFRREYRTTPSGGCSVKYMIGTGKHSESDFKAELKSVPAPFDISIFMKATDKEKINTLFNLYPPAGDVIKMQAQIDACNDEKLSISRDIEPLKKTIARLSKAKAEIELPSGTLAEVQQEIKKVEAEYRLTVGNIERAKAEAASESKRAAQEQAKQPGPETKADVPAPTRNTVKNDPGGQKHEVSAELYPGLEESYSVTTGPTKGYTISNSIQAIIESMKRTGCEACAASLVAKRELKKVKEVSNGH